jgi:hypothetical protein
VSAILARVEFTPPTESLLPRASRREASPPRGAALYITLGRSALLAVAGCRALNSPMRALPERRDAQLLIVSSDDCSGAMAAAHGGQPAAPATPEAVLEQRAYEVLQFLPWNDRVAMVGLNRAWGRVSEVSGKGATDLTQRGTWSLQGALFAV